MPLIKSKSKQAFSKNVEASMKEGKPENQSLAIAFNVKKHAGKKKMAKGGMVPPGPREDGNPGTPAARPDDRHLPIEEYMASHFARGGRISDMDPEQAKALGHMMAEGGFIDLNPPRIDEDENYDSQNSKAARDPLYNDDQFSDDPWDSNERGDEEEKESENKLDMVGSIRKKMKLKANRD